MKRWIHEKVLMDKIENCVILAAGLGSRLRPLTDEEPKCFTEVNGKTILEQTLANLEKNGIKNTVIVVGYLKELIEKRIGKKYRNMTIFTTNLHNAQR